MKKLCAVLVASCAFNAMADSITLRNDDPESIYMAVNRTVTETETGWVSNSEIGWLHTGDVGYMTSDDKFLTNMGIKKGHMYSVGYFNANTQEYGLCGHVMSGSTRAFMYKDGQCIEMLVRDEILMTNSTANPAYIYINGGPNFPGADVINNDAGWVRPKHTYGFDSSAPWLQHMGIEKGDTYAIGFQDSHNNKFLCADDVISGSQRHFELKDNQCVEKK